MKTRYFLPAIGLIAALCFTACEKKDPFKDNKSEGYLTLKLDGQELTVTKQLTGSLHDTAANAMLVVSGMTSDNQLVTVNILFPDKQLKPGTYNLDLNGFNSLGWMKTLGSSESYAADDLTIGASSSIKIESVSETAAKGTFSGVLIHDVDETKKKTITEGKFDVTVLKMY
ncbi:hypothetical protein ACFOTA_10315 [Chitinophaga sp. GCM10012297]|uniref:DUF4625 domain-containing protein n=1 Tax=Chitinophaga chungangae TaxID=2821488 RepID=A0ABS3YD46_9BACT|nr:hypothetical protein [Chitinophaga chungangae]MBO9152600.1 hypothetical protein [Chitinophaga chungangae]